jgi:hypothetical protein
LAGLRGDEQESLSAGTRVGVLSNRDNAGEVLVVMSNSEENIELEFEVDEDVDGQEFVDSGDCGCVSGSGCKE